MVLSLPLASPLEDFFEIFLLTFLIQCQIYKIWHFDFQEEVNKHASGLSAITTLAAACPGLRPWFRPGNPPEYHGF